MTHLYRRLAAVAMLLVAWLAPSGASAAEKLVLAFGDSLTAGYELPSGKGYPGQLEALLRAQGIAVQVHNAGVSGDTTNGGKARLGWVVGALKAKPDLVILCLGGNDSLRGIDPKLTRANLDAMLGDLKKRGIKVLLAGMLAPPNMGADYAKAYNALFPALARQHGVLFYPFLLQGVAANPKLQLDDGMHPNVAGAGVIARNLLPLVSKALKPS